MTTDSDHAAQLVTQFTTLVAEFAEVTVKERRAFDLGLLDPVATIEFTDGMLRGLWVALVLVVRWAPGSDAELGRRLLQVEQQLPEHLRWLTDDRDHLDGAVDETPDDFAAEVYQRSLGVDTPRRTHDTLDTVNRVLSRADNPDWSLS
ncbi:hypothetical protein [Nocardia sp. NPDC004860]|uniref:hypothetical protein n=1 Tax=Nocardia sp. NPDC004860 TaxID=3154557 RepID=UPI0033B8F31F